MGSDAQVERRSWRRRSAGIFISYRRADTAPYAGRIRDHLVAAFPRAEVFMDIDGIAPGDDFAHVIDQKLERCQVALALIGGRWLVTDDRSGARGPAPYVVREVATALRRGIRVIPVLVAGAQLPRPADLPPELMPLLQRNALEIDDKRFVNDMRQLLVTLREELPATRRSWVWAGAALAVAIVACVGWFALAPTREVSPQTIKAAVLPESEQRRPTSPLPTDAAETPRRPVGEGASPLALGQPSSPEPSSALGGESARRAPAPTEAVAKGIPVKAALPPSNADCQRALERFRDNHLREACPLVLACNAGKVLSVGVQLAVADCQLDRGARKEAIEGYCEVKRRALSAPMENEAERRKRSDQAEYANRRLLKLGHQGC